MPEGQGPSPVALVVAAGGLAGIGYLGYRYWYLPAQMRKDLSRYTAQTGLPPRDALAALGQVGCQAFGAKYGLPPQASGQICSEMSQMAAALARELPQLVGGTLSAVGGGVGAIGTGVGTGVAGVARGVGSGITDIGKAPINVVAYGAGTAYGGAKTVVNDVYKGTKTVISDVGKAGSKIIKGIASLF